MSHRKRKSKEVESRGAKCWTEDTGDRLGPTVINANSRGRFPAATSPFSTHTVWELTLMIRHQKNVSVRCRPRRFCIIRVGIRRHSKDYLNTEHSERVGKRQKELRVPFSIFFYPFPLILVFTAHKNKSNLYKWANAYWMRLRRRSMDLPLTPTPHCLYLFPLRN